MTNDPTTTVTNTQRRIAVLALCMLGHSSTLETLDNPIFRSNLRGLEYQERGMRTFSQRTNMTIR